MKVTTLQFEGEHGTVYAVFFMAWHGSAWNDPSEARKSMCRWAKGTPVFGTIAGGSKCEARA